jgi:protein-tyrosine phosphatase
VHPLILGGANQTRVETSHQLAAPVTDTPHVVGQPAQASIALVCTANRCRSPLAEHILRAEAAARGLSVHVSSMGLLQSGMPMPDRGIAVAREFGLDLSRHRSERLRMDKLAEVDLVLGMSRGHGREVVSAMPAIWPRVFTLKQFSRFVAGNAIPRRARLASWIEAEAEARARSELLGRVAEDDVADPLRASAAQWRRVIHEIRIHIARVLDDCRPLLEASARDRPEYPQ